MSDYGIIVTKQGSSPETASDKAKTLNSSDNYLKIVKFGQVSITTDGSGNGKKVIPHGLNYAPAHYTWRKGSMNYATLDATTYTNCFTPVNGQTSKWITNNDKIYSYTNSSDYVIGLAGAAASTKYNFAYYLFIDPAQVPVDTRIVGTQDVGLKVSRDGKDVIDDGEQSQSFTSSYRYLKDLYQGKQGATVSITGYTASLQDQNPTGGGYVDFIHKLGYQPFYLAFLENSAGYNYELPQLFQSTLGSTSYAITDIIDSWCDITRIRIGVFNQATWDSAGWGDNSSFPFFTGSCKLKVYIFEENLNYG